MPVGCDVRQCVIARRMRAGNGDASHATMSVSTAFPAILTLFHLSLKGCQTPCLRTVACRSCSGCRPAGAASAPPLASDTGAWTLLSSPRFAGVAIGPNAGYNMSVAPEGVCVCVIWMTRRVPFVWHVGAKANFEYHGILESRLINFPFASKRTLKRLLRGFGRKEEYSTSVM